MKLLILIIAIVLVGCGKKEDSEKASPPDSVSDPIHADAIRNALKKPYGALTEADLEKVTRLRLSSRQLTELPKELEKLTQLTELSLNDNKLTDVKGLEKLTKLEDLRLYENKLTDVEGLGKLDQLRTLKLMRNQLTDLKGLEKLTKLEYLSLSDNQLSEVDGLKKLTQLKKLYLQNSQISDLSPLKDMRQLKLLALANNPDLTKAQIAELKKALPKCKIYSNPKK